MAYKSGIPSGNAAKEATIINASPVATNWMKITLPSEVSRNFTLPNPGGGGGQLAVRL